MTDERNPAHPGPDPVEDDVVEDDTEGEDEPDTA